MIILNPGGQTALTLWGLRANVETETEAEKGESACAAHALPHNGRATAGEECGALPTERQLEAEREGDEVDSGGPTDVGGPSVRYVAPNLGSFSPYVSVTSRASHPHPVYLSVSSRACPLPPTSPGLLCTPDKQHQRARGNKQDKHLACTTENLLRCRSRMHCGGHAARMHCSGVHE